VKLLGHPLHPMVIHFPVALWPAHALLHVFSGRLPPGVAAVAGFWVLAAGTTAGWLAAYLGALDLKDMVNECDPRRLRTGLVHAGVNGLVLVGFTAILALEYARYPRTGHGAGFLAGEFALLAALGLGNYFGGELVWGRPADA
jgi:uncharacterized membrane protein